MGGFTTAPLDPIFWLHHCNIDRLWKVWLRDAAHVNPATADWLTSVSFSFHDATGATVSMTPSQVLDTRPQPLDYIYDDEP
jgi:tyrosinase